MSRDGISWVCTDPVVQRPNVQIQWSSLKDQQVSSTSSPKAMIRLALLNGSSIVMEFKHAGGLSQAFKVRDQVKELIIREIATLPSIEDRLRSGNGCNPMELKHRAAALASQPLLKRQHMEMVDSGLISEEDFWAGRRDVLATEANKRQKRVKTSELLTDLAAQTGPGDKVVKYNLNAEIIHQIFVQYPIVYQTYKAQVPDRMSESEFWGLFFKSKYFHRDRDKVGHEDIFTKHEDANKTKPMAHLDPRDRVDPLLDLSSTNADHEVVNPDIQVQSSDDLSKFNRHAAYVLDTTNHIGKYSSLDSPDVRQKISLREKQARIVEATRLPDLEVARRPEYFKLKLEDETRYFQRDRMDVSMENGTADSKEALNMENLSLAKAFPSSIEAKQVVQEMERVVTSQSLEQTATGPTIVDIPVAFKQQVFAHFQNVCELLRHFWAFSTMNCRSLEDEEKLDRIVARMEQKYDQLQQIRQSLSHDQRSTLGPLLKPFDDQLNHAFVKREEQKQEITVSN